MTNRLDMKSISKSFDSNRVLNSVDLELPPGTVLALLGENGAGKSTLMKILNGDYTKDSGDIYIDGKKVEITSPRLASQLGIRVIYQELNYLQDLSVVENVLLGHLPLKHKWIVDFKESKRRTIEILKALDVDIDPNEPVRNLSIANKQLVEIAKALSTKAKILVMDEPTAALTSKEINKLFKIIRKLAADGVSIIYISHRLEEIEVICDKIMIMRDGQRVGFGDKKEITLNEIVKLMVGKEVDEKISKNHNIHKSSPALQVHNLTKVGFFQNVSFTLHQGEIVGLYGLLGSGINDVTKALFGASPADSGEILINDRTYRFRSTEQAKHTGIAFVPADRKIAGLILGMHVWQNLTLANMGKYSRLGFLKSSKEKETSASWVQKLAIKLSGGIEREIKFLSGGNQQKVIISRWLDTNAKVLIMNEPTMGVDIGSRSDIYELLDQLRARGMAIIVASSDINELEMISDRILIMRNGNLVAEVEQKDLTREKILSQAMGVEK